VRHMSLRARPRTASDSSVGKHIQPVCVYRVSHQGCDVTIVFA